MTTAEQNRAIAEWCGWTDIHLLATPLTSHGFYGFPPGETAYGRVPDYTTDLNAIHEAEKHLSQDQQFHYVRNLYQAMQFSPEIRIGTIHATAAQRAEALLRTIGKWKE